MYKLRIKNPNEHKKEMIFINPKCGHVQICDYSIPFRCQDKACLEDIPQVDRLAGDKNQGARVKFFAEGKI